MITTSDHFKLLRSETEQLIGWVREHERTSGHDRSFARRIVTRLGANYDPKTGKTTFGFWTPELAEWEIDPQHIFLELLTPHAGDTPDLNARAQQMRFQRERINMLRDGAFTWAVVSGITPGSREQIGTLYRLLYQNLAGDWAIIHDHMAYSIPFGVFAPAEVYDMQTMFAERQDVQHFQQQLDTQPDPDGVPRVQFPGNILQIHARYASEDASIAGLTRLYGRIAEKIRNGEDLDAAEQNYIGYDAIQLMPVEPIIEYEGRPEFWQELPDESDEQQITVKLRKPDMTNWGYDVVISASPAVNPALLESRRPHELLGLIEMLHDFPGKPIKVMLDIVYGHIDNQALPLLNKAYFAGANMYGQNVDLREPTVRAILTEMMRRKHNYGFDGIRVDGAQDFKWWDAETGEMIHDDDFLHKMNDVTLDVAGVTYRPWMIFEDGRPWPRDDWELASTYREVTKQMPNVWQWGPLTFAHNTPFLFTFWMSKWWRIREMADIGREWITGCANHDTLRRGSQVPLDARVNTYLGDTLPEIIENAYDNPAAKLFDYAMMPGIPMDFINASMRAPWGFIRNTDDRYGVKVVSEEARWLYWRLQPVEYIAPDAFTRLKELDFRSLEGLRRFMTTLDHAVQATHYNLDAIVAMLRNSAPPLDGPALSVPILKQIARAFMDDVHDFCNVARYWGTQDSTRTQYKLNLREFRRQRRWLIDNLRGDECLTYMHPTEGAAVFYGRRISPDGREQLLFVANMEGAPRSLTPAELPLANFEPAGWRLALTTPGLNAAGVSDEWTLHDSQGMLFVR